jgi:hypothetical protein
MEQWLLDAARAQPRKGYTGTIHARGRPVEVKNGHAEQDGVRLFVEEDGTVVHNGKLIGRVKHTLEKADE